jgi:uncharacterized protein
MRWGDFRRSDNVEDATGGGGGGGFPLGGGVKLGGGAIVLIVVASLLFGVNPLEMLGVLESGPGTQPPPASMPSQTPPGYGPQYGPAPGATRPAAPAPNPAKDFVSAVLGDTEDVWHAVFTAMGAQYEEPKLRLYSGLVQSACGRASASVGPFYCAADERVYLDTAFFAELSRRFGAPGDFAQAYVIAHEIGHHVQNQLGIMREFEQKAQRMDARGRNALSVRLELQADCFAGVWGHFAQKRNLLEPGDLEEGIRAAQAVGDDQIQKRTQGYVVSDAFTHGSAEQRTRWFRTGFESGDPRSCNTFAVQRL